MKIILAGINSKFIHSNPAIYSLAAYAGEYSDFIKLCEYTINMPYDEIRGELYRAVTEGEQASDGDGKVLMFSCYIWNISVVLDLVRDFKKLLPMAEIWLGGPEAGWRAKSILAEYGELRGIFVGEGEASFKETARAYISGIRDLKSIKGIVFRSFDSGEITDNGMPETVSMDDIPFWYRDEKTGHLKEIFANRILYYESQRGCPYRCSYCLSSIDKSVRFRSPEKVFDDIGFFLEERVKQVKFIDRTFNCSPAHAIPILEFIRDHDNGVTNFHFEIEGDILTDDEIRLLQGLKPGLVQLEIGVQTVNSQTLEAVNRRNDIEGLKKNVAALVKNRNIHIHLDLIAGLPYEDAKSFENSFNEVYGMHPNELQLGFLKVLHGSLIGEEAHKYGIVYSQTPPYEVLSTDRLSYSDILQLKKIERVLETYHNSMQFSTALSCLEKLYDRPYDMYLELAGYEEKTGYDRLNPSRLKKYELFYGFASEKAPELKDVFADALLYDLYLRENIRSLPNFAIARKNYSCIKQEGDRNLIHTGHFDYPVCADVTFDYAHRDPVTGNATVTVCTTVST